MAVPLTVAHCLRQWATGTADRGRALLTAAQCSHCASARLCASHRSHRSPFPHSADMNSCAEAAAVAASSSPAASVPAVPVAVTASVLVIGGGIAGCALALFLHRAGVQVEIFEAYPSLATVEGGLGLASNGMNVLKSLGLADALAARSSPTTHFEFANHEGQILGSVAIHGAQRYGVDGVACSRLALHRVLHDALEARGVRVRYGKRLTSIDDSIDGVTATFDDGTSARGGVLVGADGLHSRTRGILFPDCPPPHFLGLLGFGGGVAVEELSVADRAGMPESGRMRLIFGPLGFFGLSGFGLDEQDRPVLGWWSNAPEERQHTKQEMGAMTPKEIGARLSALHGDWSAPIPSLLSRIDAPKADPITRVQIFDVQMLSQWSKGRCVLMGDAAHAMSPNSGQGASMALEDAMYLALLLSRARCALTVGAATGTTAAAVAAGAAATEAFSPALSGPESLGVIRGVCAQFQTHRKPRCDKINTEARSRGDTKKKSFGPWARWFRDAGMRFYFWFAQLDLFESKFGADEFGYKIPGYDEI